MNHALIPMERLLLTIRFCACGSFLIVIGDFTSIHKSTASKTIDKVLNKCKYLVIKYLFLKYILGDTSNC
jgi:hypothetical protein